MSVAAAIAGAIASALASGALSSAMREDPQKPPGQMLPIPPPMDIGGALANLGGLDLPANAPPPPPHQASALNPQTPSMGQVMARMMAQKQGGAPMPPPSGGGYGLR